MGTTLPKMSERDHINVFRKQVPEPLEDHLRKGGAPIGIRSDQANAKLYGRTKYLVCMYNINDSQSEAAYQHQNRCIQTLFVQLNCFLVSRSHQG